jgi:predicted RNA-binding Zn-ribbon protein involved in translation (DUF1610 family)
MNHSRSNAPIKFCPTCGELINASAGARCDEQKHASRRKERLHYCFDCGKNLIAPGR